MFKKFPVHIHEIKDSILSFVSNISSTSHMTYLMPVLELCYFHICPFVCFFLNYLSKMNDVMNEVRWMRLSNSGMYSALCSIFIMFLFQKLQ